MEISLARNIGGSPLHFYARSLKPTRTGLHLAAIYSAFAVIAAVMFGTLSVYSF